ncbi:MAG: 8-oxo-dGTP diphosphatase MutT [Gammaproteobacteria bacterium]|nr:8-oxo-dGTP diphosphatase MutT [Gammaproteobacteria bacterium]
MEIHVVAGVLVRDDASVLIAKRLPGTHMAGRWEFPGGKLEPGEIPSAGLARELREELGIEVLAAEPLLHLSHQYTDRHVHLDVWLVTQYQGVPRSLEGQALQWVLPELLYGVDLLEADAPIIEALLRRPG